MRLDNKTELAIINYDDTKSSKQIATLLSIDETDVLKVQNNWIAMLPSEQDAYKEKLEKGKVLTKAAPKKRTSSKSQTGVPSIVKNIKFVTYASGKQLTALHVTQDLLTKTTTTVAELLAAAQDKNHEKRKELITMRKALAAQVWPDATKPVGAALQMNYTILSLERIHHNLINEA